MLFGTLTYTLGCFPLDIRPYHRTSETILLNNYLEVIKTFLSLTHIGTFSALLTFKVNYFCESLLYSSCSYFN